MFRDQRNLKVLQ